MRCTFPCATDTRPSAHGQAANSEFRATLGYTIEHEGLEFPRLRLRRFKHTGGVLLTFSYLIVPAVCGNYLAHTLRRRLVLGWIVATVASLARLCLTPAMDLRAGATIVCLLGLLLAITMFLARWVPATPMRPAVPCALPTERS